MAGSKQRRIFLFSFNFRDLWLAMMLRKNGPSSSGVVVVGVIFFVFLLILIDRYMMDCSNFLL